MAHIGVFCPPVSGHLNPIATLGRALRRRGHRVTVFQIGGMRERIQAEQLEFQGLGEDDTRAGELAEALGELRKRTGLSALRFTIDGGRRLASLICEHGPKAVRAAGIDLLLVDDNEPAGGAVAQHLGIPFVSFGSIPLLREASVPPSFVPWAYHPGRLPALRNTIAHTVFEQLISPIQSVVNGYRAEWKLPRIRRPQDTLSPYLQMSQLISELDFPRTRKPRCLEYLGPIFDAERPPVRFPFERLNGKPIVYASFGTLQNGRPEYFVAVAKACQSLHVQLVLSTGGTRFDESELPTSAIAVPYAPQLELLSRAALCVTHGGLNTVLECLRHAVPMVCVPITNDQPAVAARIRWSRAGTVVPLKGLNPHRLRTAIGAVFDDRSYRDRLEYLSRAVIQAGGVERGADLVERVLQHEVTRAQLSATASA